MIDENANPRRDSEPRLKFSNSVLQDADCKAPAIQMMDRFTRIPDGNVQYGAADDEREDIHSSTGNPPGN